MPKRPANSYFLFQADVRASVVAKNPALEGNVSEIAKHVGKMWLNLDPKEKKVYEARAKKARDAFEAEHGKIEYGRKKPKAGEAPKKRMRPTGFIVFSIAVRPKIIEAHPAYNSQVPEVAKIIGAQWRALSEENKEMWRQQAASMDSY